MDNIMQIKEGPSREKLFDSFRLGNRSYGTTVEFTGETQDSEVVCIEVSIETLSLVFRSKDIWTFFGSIKPPYKLSWGNGYFETGLLGQYDTTTRTGWMKFAAESLLRDERDWWKLQGNEYQ